MTTDMKFEAQGEWMVGTPLIAGVGPGLEAALKCSHPSWTEECREIKEVFLVVMDRCTACRFATRGRYRKLKEGESV